MVGDDGDPAARDVVDRARADHPDLDLVFLDRRDGEPGASASRNLGARTGHAPVIAFLDDDDLWEPGYLAAALGRLEATGADVVVTATRRLTDTGLGEPAVPRADLDPRAVFRAGPGVTGSSTVVRRAAFDRVDGFDPGLPVQNDRDFFLRLLDAGQAYAVQPEALVLIRQHALGRLTDASARRADGVLLFLAKHGPRFSWWDRRALRYTSHYTRMSSATDRAVFLRSAYGALVNWSPSAARDLPLALLRIDRLRSLAKKLVRGPAW